MRTRLTTVEEAQRLIVETIINKTTKVTKISDDSVLGGISFGIAKVFQKAQKDIALVETYLYPDFADGEQLDGIASDRGVPSRFPALGSSVYIRLTGEAGTNYSASIHTVTGNHGIVFQMEEDVTIPVDGFTFVKVRSIEEGAKTKVDANSLTQINSAPTGHQAVTNDFRAIGGRDIEADVEFRIRIKEGANIAAQKTLSYIEQLFLRINPKILRVFFQGNQLGKTILAIATQTGENLSQDELDELLLIGGESLAISDLKDFDIHQPGVVLQNIEWYPIDIDFYVNLDASFDVDDVRRSIQIQMENKLDPRTWIEGDTVRWDDLFNIVKNITPVKYLPNKLFTINGGTNSIKIPRTQVPRIRAFVMRDLEGNIISDTAGNLQEIAFPLSPNQQLQETLLSDV